MQSADPDQSLLESRGLCQKLPIALRLKEHKRDNFLGSFKAKYVKMSF
jgi:hypothetical protein